MADTPLSDESIIVPIEIRDGVFARLQIPKNLTREEAEKVARVAIAYGGQDG